MPAVVVVDVLIAIFALALAAIGWQRGLIRSVLPLLGFVGGAAIGGRLGPALLPDGSESAYAPIVTLLSGVLLGAAFAVAMEGVGVVLRERLVGGREPGFVEGLGGALLLGALGLLIAWAFGAVALHCTGADCARPALGGAALGDPRRAQRHAATIGAPPERAAPDRPDAGARGARGEGRGARPGDRLRPRGRRGR